MYKYLIKSVKTLAGIENNALRESVFPLAWEGRVILKDGYLVDPKNKIEGNYDVAFKGDQITEVGIIEPVAGDVVLDCKGTRWSYQV